MRLIVLLSILTLTSCQKCYECYEQTYNISTMQTTGRSFEVCKTTKQMREVYQEGTESVDGVYRKQIVCNPIE